MVMKVTKKISNSGQKFFFKLVLLFSRICQAKIEQCTVLITKGLYFDHKSIYSYTRFSRARTSAIVFAFAQNGTAAAAPRAARVPIDNEQSKYFLFQLSFVSQSGGIPLSFLLSFHLYHLCRVFLRSAFYLVMYIFLSIQICCTNCFEMIKHTSCLVLILY